MLFHGMKLVKINEMKMKKVIVKKEDLKGGSDELAEIYKYERSNDRRSFERCRDISSYY